jgi:hypothetical protein
MGPLRGTSTAAADQIDCSQNSNHIYDYVRSGEIFEASGLDGVNVAQSHGIADEKLHCNQQDKPSEPRINCGIYPLERIHTRRWWR